MTNQCGLEKNGTKLDVSETVATMTLVKHGFKLLTREIISIAPTGGMTVTHTLILTIGTKIVTIKTTAGKESKRNKLKMRVRSPIKLS